MSEKFLSMIKSRRVIRELDDRPIDDEQLVKILESARWAPAGGNQRTNRFVAIQNPEIIQLLRMFSPGMFQNPQAIILVCIDWDVAAANQFAETDQTAFIDVGATMQTMMLAAHSMGLGSGPVTSFSKDAVRIVLNLPANLSPEMMICVGHPAPKSVSQLPMRPNPKKRVTWQSLTDWDRFKD
jgi:nitroreductase